MSQKDDVYFWEGAREGRLLLRSCAACGRIAHPPVPMCPHCHSLEWGTQQASGRGTVYAWIDSRHPSRPDSPSRIVALIDLEEGVRIVSNLRGTALDAIEPDAPVEVFFEEINGHAMPQFRIVEGRQ